jgi:hypothetical protein
MNQQWTAFWLLRALWALWEASDYYLPPEDLLDCDCNDCSDWQRRYLNTWINTEGHTR